MLRSRIIGKVKSPGNPWSQYSRRERLRWEGIAEKERFKPGMKESRRGSRILQGRVSKPSERHYFDPCYRNQTIVLVLEEIREIVGTRRSYNI